MRSIIQQKDNKDDLSAPFLFILFFIIISICYFNSFYCSWHLDDIQNILLNEPLHLTDLSNNSLKQTFFAYPMQTGRLFRPITNLTFGLNWFFGQDNVVGYHIVNFLIHLFVTFFLYQSCFLLLSTPRFGYKYQDKKIFIAAFSAIIWSVNPIQTQTVTYIVQRAAALSTLFSIIGIWLYLKARFSVFNKQKIFFYISTVIFFILAILSKENAVLFPMTIFLIEILFFQKDRFYFRVKTILFFIGLVSIILLFIFLFEGKYFFKNILASYEDRSFSILERILTQPRIILFYISLIIYPSTLRLSIEHDIQISTSLISPFTTLVAISFLIIVIFFSILYYKKYPLLSFSILFFFLNHLVESSFIALEMIFEHRNYLPSLFFFLPIADLISTAMEKYKFKKKIIYQVICAGVVSLIILFSLSTILRNMAWYTDTTLWLDALTKAPRSRRPYINLAYNFKYEGDYKGSLDLYQVSLEKNSSTPWRDTFVAYNGIGGVLMHIGNYKEAAFFFDKSVKLSRNRSRSLYIEALFLKAKAFWMDKQREEAFNIIEKEKEFNKKNMLFYAEMLINFNQNNQALAWLRRVLSESDFHSNEYKMSLLAIAFLYDKIGNPEKANLYLRLASNLDAPKIPTLLFLLEHNIRGNKSFQTEQVFVELLKYITWSDFISMIDNLLNDYSAISISSDRIKKYASDWLELKKNINQ